MFQFYKISALGCWVGRLVLDIIFINLSYTAQPKPKLWRALHSTSKPPPTSLTVSAKA